MPVRHPWPQCSPAAGFHSTRLDGPPERAGGHSGLKGSERGSGSMKTAAAWLKAPLKGVTSARTT